MNLQNYPFSALVGQEGLKMALLINAVDPLIGGVLIRGHKGSGKSTAARALSALLPSIEAIDGCPYHCDPDLPEIAHDGCQALLVAKKKPDITELPTPMVELPLSATEDRIIGTLNIEAALKKGERQFEPGLLAAANRGILYVDEVNLLADHLVDLLLDVAASGINIVEREGLRHSHPARFMLIGTMNPEEGDLRPQFLDRFGLCITVQTINDSEQRTEIIRRRIAFEEDPEAFLNGYMEEERILKDQIVSARASHQAISVDDAIYRAAVDIAIESGVQGHRTEITLIRAAKALAALLDRQDVSEQELSEAARLVLPHRIAKSPLENPGDLQDRIEELLAKTLGIKADIDKSIPDDAAAMLDNHDFPGAAAAGSMLFTYLKKKVRNEHLSRSTASS